jgi:hypothetical protein
MFRIDMMRLFAYAFFFPRPPMIESAVKAMFTVATEGATQYFVEPERWSGMFNVCPFLIFLLFKPAFPFDKRLAG